MIKVLSVCTTVTLICRRPKLIVEKTFYSEQGLTNFLYWVDSNYCIRLCGLHVILSITYWTLLFKSEKKPQREKFMKRDMVVCNKVLFIKTEVGWIRSEGWFFLPALSKRMKPKCFYTGNVLIKVLTNSQMCQETLCLGLLYQDTFVTFLGICVTPGQESFNFAMKSCL